MGTFGGHALPGSFFVIFAIWWTTQVYRRYFRSLRKDELPYRSSAVFPFSCLCQRVRSWPWEGILKMVFTAIGFAGEIITAFKDGKFAHLGNGQHATMFFFFGLSGAVDVLVHLRFPLPKDIEYVVGTLAFVVEDVLFMFHLHGRKPLDVLIHTLLVYVIHACVVVLIVETKYRDNVTVALARCYVVFLQGTWFWQAGFILYNPIAGAEKWNQDDHEQMMVVTMMFTWHMAAVFFAMMAIGVVVNLADRYSHRFDRTGLGGGGGDRDDTELGKSESNGGRKYDRLRMSDLGDRPSGDETSLLNNDSDSDDDNVTFQRPCDGSVA